MLSLFQQGFEAVFSLQIFGLVFFGTVVGIIFGAIPGLTATMAVALLSCRCSSAWVKPTAWPLAVPHSSAILVEPHGVMSWRSRRTDRGTSESYSATAGNPFRKSAFPGVPKAS